MDQNKNQINPKIRLLADPRVLGLLAFAAVALLVTWSAIRVIQTNYELERKISADRQRNAVEQLENENLKLKNKYYESDQFLELAARRQFGKAAPGEKLYLVPRDVAMSKTIDTSNNKQAAKETEQTGSKYQQNFDKWMKFLFR